MVEQFLAQVSPVGRVAYILFLLQNELDCLTASPLVAPTSDCQSAIDELQLSIDTIRDTSVHAVVNILSDSIMKRMHAGVVTKMAQRWQTLMESSPHNEHGNLIAAVTTTLVGLAMTLAGHTDANSTIQNAIIKFTAKLSHTDRKAVLESVAQAAKALMPYAKQDSMLPRDVFDSVPHWAIELTKP